jgi:hypothetical protein
MRHAALAVLLVFTACATAEQKPAAAAAEPAKKAEPAPAAEPARPAEPAAAPAAAVPAAPAGALVVEFASAGATRTGGSVSETVYSERPGDAALSRKEFADGVVTYTGQVGFGKGSQWAGMGVGFNVLPDAKPTDGGKFKTVTFRLASTTRLLRLRVTGSEEKIRTAGCYPIYIQEVTEELKDYTIPLERFKPEGWCAANAREIKDALSGLVGFEAVSTNINKKEITISVGTLTLSP